MYPIKLYFGSKIDSKKVKAKDKIVKFKQVIFLVDLSTSFPIRGATKQTKANKIPSIKPASKYSILNYC